MYGNIRQVLQYDHRIRLLEWIETPFKSGATDVIIIWHKLSVSGIIAIRSNNSYAFLKTNSIALAMIFHSQ